MKQLTNPGSIPLPLPPPRQIPMREKNTRIGNATGPRKRLDVAERATQGHSGPNSTTPAFQRGSDHAIAAAHRGYAVLRMQSAEKSGGEGAGGSGPQTRSSNEVPKPRASPSRGTQPPPKPRPPGTGSIEGPIGGARRLEPRGQAWAKSCELTYRAGRMTNGPDGGRNSFIRFPATNGEADTGRDLSFSLLTPFRSSKSRPTTQFQDHPPPERGPPQDIMW